jgi:zinc/manganese transport system ATP-binding protein
MTPVATFLRSDTGTRKGAAVTFDGAAVRLRGRTIWSDVSLTVAEADFVAVLGPNGAGKSTLIKAILGLLPLAAGTASVLGRQPGVAKGRIGYLPQRHGFDSGTRIRGVDLVQLGLDGTRWGSHSRVARVASETRPASRR